MKNPITQEEHDRAIASAYSLGYQMGKIDERNRQWATNHYYTEPMTFAEKQITAILDRKNF